MYNAYLQEPLETDLGVYSNLKNYLTTRLAIISPAQQELLHTSRLYYHETSDTGYEVALQAAQDINCSRNIHLRGKLAGVTNDMYHLVPPQQHIQFKFTKSDPKFHLYRPDDSDGEEYVVEILKAYLHLTRVRLTDKAHEAFMRRWKKESVYIMPYTRTEVAAILSALSLFITTCCRFIITL